MGIVQTTVEHLELFVVLSGFYDAGWSDCRCKSEGIDDRGGRGFNAFLRLSR